MRILMKKQGTGAVEAPAGDPYFTNVKSLLHMNGSNGGTTFTDEIGNIWTGNGGAQLSTSNVKYGTASLSLNGSDSYLTTPHNADFSPAGDTQYTVEGWFNANSFTTNGSLIGSQTAGVSVSNWQIWSDTSGRINVQLCVGGSTYDLQSSAVSTNAWHHFAFVRNGTSYTLFIDGAIADSNTWSITINTNTLPLSIGAATNGVNIFNGFMDDLRITKGVARYTTTFTPPTAEFPNS